MTPGFSLKPAHLTFRDASLAVDVCSRSANRQDRSEPTYLSLKILWLWCLSRYLNGVWMMSRLCIPDGSLPIQASPYLIRLQILSWLSSVVPSQQRKPLPACRTPSPRFHYPANSPVDHCVVYRQPFVAMSSPLTPHFSGPTTSPIHCEILRTHATSVH